MKNTTHIFPSHIHGESTLYIEDYDFSGHVDCPHILKQLSMAFPDASICFMLGKVFDPPSSLLSEIAQPILVWSQVTLCGFVVYFFFCLKKLARYALQHTWCCATDGEYISHLLELEPRIPWCGSYMHLSIDPIRIMYEVLNIEGLHKELRYIFAW